MTPPGGGIAGGPEAPAGRRPISPVEAFEAAVALHRAGRLAEAEQFYRKILELEPGHFGAMHYLGLACTQQGRLDEAVTLLQKAVALDSKSFEARTNLGIALAGLRRFDGAIAEYEAAIALQPDYAEARNNLGIALQSLHRHPEAIAQFEGALARKPGNAFLHYNLGLSLAAEGRHDEAAAQYRQAVALKPDHVEAHGNLGATLGLLQRHEEAIAAFERALALKPGLAEAHNDIGNALVALKRHEEAVERYRRALAIRPDFADAHNNIGNALTVLDRHRQAIAHFKAALAIDPDAFETHVSLAGALTHVERHDEAIVQYRAALALHPDHAELNWLLGGALEAGNRPEDAIVHHRRALEIKPDFADAHNSLGTSLMTLGRLGEAHRAIETAIGLKPARSDFHRNLAVSRRYAAGDAHLQAMEQLARDMASLEDGQRMELHFALGKAYTDIDRRQEALCHLIEANAIKRRQIQYDETAALAQIERIKQVMTRDLLRRRFGQGADSGLPVFILGMPRSGSTLIEQILASHPAVFGAGELGNFGAAVADLAGPAAAPASFIDIVPDMPGERLAELGTRYLDSVRALAPDAARITDKMLANFRMVGIIHLALPGARIIHARRDPLDTCLSCFGRNFAKGHQPFTYDLAELGRYYRAYDGLMAHWRDVLPAGVMLELQYEDLVADLEPQARNILAHCGLDWDPRCLAFHQTERPVRTASMAQVREPIYRSSIGRWGSVRHMLRPLLDELGIEG